MKYLILFFLFYSNAYAWDVFIEPGVFVDMFDGESVSYDDGSHEYSGTLRNKDLSYAMKFGLHNGKWEIGLESEVYNLVAHFEGDGIKENFSKEIQVTYNSFFIGYEFYPKNIIYFSISNTPYLTTGTESYEDDHSIISMEYAYHLKDWVSVNIKIENASKLTNKGGATEKTYKYKDLILVGFSFPLSSHDGH